jgi:hypothetical protein
VHMSHSIEHVSHPLATLEKVHKLLHEGGLVYIETPNIASFTARRCGTYWFPLESPRHLWLFDPVTLRRALQQSGFDCTKLWTKPFPALRWDSTYRREERMQRFLPKRPTMTAGSLPRAMTLGTVTAVLRLLGRPSAEQTCCWARRA